MMGFFRFAQKVQSSLKPLPIRAQTFSGSSSPPDRCFIMGKYGPVAMSGHSWAECYEHFKKNPLLSPIIPNRLILNIDPGKPYISNDQSRDLIQTGLFLPFYANERQESYSGSFRRENMGVLEELNMFAFRELKQDSERKWLSNPSAGFNEYGSVLKEFLQPTLRSSGSSIILPPDDISSLLTCLSASVVDELEAMDHPSTFPDLLFSTMMIEIYRLLMEQCSVLEQYPTANAIFSQVGKDAPPGCLSIFRSHAFLNAFIPRDLKNPEFVRAKAATRGHGASAAGTSPGSGGDFGGGNPGNGGRYPAGSGDGYSAGSGTGYSAGGWGNYGGPYPAGGWGNYGGPYPAGDGGNYGGPYPAGGGGNYSCGYPAGGGGNYSGGYRAGGGGNYGGGYPAGGRGNYSGSYPARGGDIYGGGYPAGGRGNYSGSDPAGGGNNYGGSYHRNGDASGGGLPGSGAGGDSHQFLPLLVNDTDVMWQTGRLLISGIRHCCIHPVKMDSKLVLIFLPRKSARNLKRKPPTKAESIQLVRNTFSDSLLVCFRAFRTQGKWDMIDIRSYRPISQIYLGKYSGQ